MTVESWLFDIWWIDDCWGCHWCVAADEDTHVNVWRVFWMFLLCSQTQFSLFLLHCSFHGLQTFNLLQLTDPFTCAPSWCQNSHLKICNIIDPENLPVPDPTVCTEVGSYWWLTVRSFVRLSHCLGCPLLGENEIPLHWWRAPDHQRSSVHKTGCFGKLSYDGCSTHRS